MSVEINLSDTFVMRTEAGGDASKQWLQSLPELLDYCALRWSLTILPPFTNLSFHYVAPVVCADGSDAVLKIGPGRLFQEVETLRTFGGLGCVRLIDTDVGRGIMLLERIRPGAVLSSMATDSMDEKATANAASVMRALWRHPPADHRLPTIDDWEDGAPGFAELRNRFDGGTGPMPKHMVERAEGLFADLSSSVSENVVLHGDLHHDNILSAEREPWLAIDPKGVIGEPAYEIGAILRNYWMDRQTISNPQKLAERRIHRFGEILNIDKVRIRDWAIAQAVLSVIWGIDYSDKNWTPDLWCVEMLGGIKL